VTKAVSYSRILVVANQDLYNNATAREKIDRYIGDIQNAFHCTMTLETVSGGSCIDIKNLIKNYYNSGLAGVVCIGRIPPAMYEVPNDHYWWEGGYGYAKWPCDLYYADMDGTWSDNDNNGIFDDHTDGSGDKAPEIFIGRIDTRTMGDYGDEVTLFGKYMDKNHNYWMGNVGLTQKALRYTESDFVNSDRTDINGVYGAQNTTYVGYPDTSKSDWLNNRCQTDWGLIQAWTHGSWDSHSLTGGNVTTADAVNAKPRWIGFNLIACSISNWVAGNDRRFLCGGYVYNDSPKALTIIGSSKTGGMLYCATFYNSIVENNCMGQALADWFSEVITNYSKYNRDYGYILGWFYGLQIVGDPMIVYKQLPEPGETPVPTGVPTSAPTPEPTATIPPTGDYILISQNGWSLVYVDSEELSGEDGAATNFFDGDTATFWHTEWESSEPPHPHEIQIDLGTSYTIGGIRYLPRQDGEENGIIAEYEIYVSTGTANWGSADAYGTWAHDTAEKEVLFGPVPGRYIRLVALSEINGAVWTSGAELNVLEYTGEATPTPIPDANIGDANGDGNINIVDALLVAQCYVGIGSCPDASIADVNCDGKIDIVDALLIAQYYVGLISNLGC
jgi:hypothetical protein